MRELRFWLKILALGAGLGAATFWCVMEASLKGGTVTMPDLSGLPEGGAAAKLRSLGLSMDVRERRYSTTEPFGAVLSQSQEAGTTLKRGRTIAVVVSEGDKVLAVPQLVGGPSLRQAALILEQNGLAQGRVATVPDPSPAGTVLAQSPEAGQALDRGAAVSLLVSEGPPAAERLMPRLAGATLADARALAERMGLVLRQVVERADAAAAPGTVLAQSLTPLARVAEGAELDLVVAPGGSAQAPARLATVAWSVPEDGAPARRVTIVVSDSLGRRTVFNRMLEAGDRVNRDVLVHGTATAEVDMSGAPAASLPLP